MSEILVTGCAGFIGSRTCELLLEAGHKVIGIDNINEYYDKNLKWHRLESLIGRKGFEFYEIDIEEMEPLKEIFDDNDISAVINLAARAGVRYSIENPHIYATTNINGSLNLLELMRQKGINKFVLASSSSLYAGEKMPFTEDMPVNKPISPYAATKKAAEMIAYSYHHLFKIDVSILRYFTVYGPAGRPDMSYFRFFKQVDSGDKLTIFGDGTQTRDFTFIDDIARGTILALKEVGYEIINLGCGRKPVELNYMIEQIEKHLGKTANKEYADFHSADMKETGADISKAKNILGWEPQVTIEEGIARVAEWYKANEELIKSIEL